MQVLNIEPGASLNPQKREKSKIERDKAGVSK